MSSLNKAALTCRSLTLIPPSCSAMACSMARFSISVFLDMRCQLRCRILNIHISISRSKNVISSTGLCSPILIGLPTISVPPLASTTWIIRSTRLSSSKNSFPSPFPRWASGTSPATSTSCTGTNLMPFTQEVQCRMCRF